MARVVQFFLCVLFLIFSTALLMSKNPLGWCWIQTRLASAANELASHDAITSRAKKVTWLQLSIENFWVQEGLTAALMDNKTCYVPRSDPQVT